MSDHPDQKELILVLGMHRSGTSVVTRLVSLLGFGLPANLIEANEFNEAGYWESLDVRTINDQLLRDVSSAWFDPLPINWDAVADRTSHLDSIRAFLVASQAENPSGMVVKDPRICRTAPFWLDATDQLGLNLKIVLAYRNPLEVAASLRRRDRLSRALSLDLWSRHVLEAERHARGRECLLVSYASLFDEQGSGLEALGRVTGIDPAALDESKRTTINDFVSSGYRHHCSTLDDLAKQLGKGAIAFRLFELLEQIGPSESGQLSNAFDELRSELDAIHKAGSPTVPYHVSKHFRPRAHKPNTPETITIAAEDRMALREVAVSQARQIRKGERQRALLGERIAKLESAIKHLESELANAREALDQAKTELENKVAEVSRLGSLSQSLQQNLTDLNQLMELKQAQLEELTAAFEELRAETNRTRHSLELANESRHLRGQHLARAVERRKEVEHTKSVLLRRLQREKREVQRLRRTRDQLQRQQQTSAAQIASLEYQLATRAALNRSPRYLARKLWLATKSAMARKLALNRRIKLLTESGTFDPDWYVFTYPDLRRVGVLDEELAVHYLLNGGFEGRNPCAYFDSAWYLETNADVAETGINPLLHYLVHGRREGRDPHPLISTQWYAERYPDCGGQQFALEHFMREGDADGHSPSPEFSADEYLELHQDVAQSGMPPFYHYVTFGSKEGRELRKPRPDPKPWDGLKLRIFQGVNGEVRDTLPPARRAIKRRNLMLVAHTAGDRLFGAERSFLDVCQAVDLTQFNVIVVLPRPNRVYLEHVSRYADRVYSFRYQWWRAGQEVDENVVETFRHLISENDIDLVYGNTIMTREPFIAAAQENVVSVMHIREIISSDTHLLEMIGQNEARIREEIQKRADYLIVNSNATAREFEAKKERFLVYNAIDVEDFIALENEPGEYIYVGIISSNLPKKGIDDFIRLAIAARERLPRLVFRVIGPQSDCLDELMADLPEGDARPNIEVCGYLDSAVEAISRVNILVNFSSFAESFGRTVAEAMAAGRPVIVYDHGALPELVEHEKTGFIIPVRAYEAALPCLEQLCQRPELIREMGEAGRRRACGLFDLPVLQQGIRQSLRLALAGDQAAEDELAGKQRSMKIAYFQWHFPVPSETFVLNELRFLLEQGHDVIVFCRQSPFPDFVPDFQVTWQRVESPEELAAQLHETGRERAHAHFVYPTVTDFLWPACELAGIPFTCIAHAQDIFRYGNDGQNRIGEIGQSPLCQRVLVPGRFHRQYLIERDVPAAKIMVNPQGIDSRLYPFSGGEDRRETRIVSCVQRFVAKKGIGDLIAAGPALKEAGVVIRIYGYGPLQQDYEKQIEALAVDNVQLCGPVRGRDELLHVIGASDLFVTPCVRADDGDMDGIPTVYMEAMAIGTPVVTTALSSIPDLVVDGVNGLICRERDPQSIASKILEYYAMPSARRLAMRLAARRRVETEFDTGMLLGRLLDLYRQRTVDIVIVSWNNPAELEEVVRRIQAYTGMPYQLIINDNGSQASVIRFLQGLERQYENVSVLFQGENLYVGPGTNRAIEAGKSEYVIYICGKEGFALLPNWERKLVEYMDSHPRAGLAGTLGYSPAYLTGKDYPKIPLFEKFRNRWFAEANPDRTFLHAQGGLFAIRRSMYAEIGGFSEAVPHDYTDVEYSYYVESCGWELGRVPGILALYHKTRPGIFARLDEQVWAIHPPTLAELERVTRIVDGDEQLCNLCAWQGDRFDDDSGLASCPACGSTPAQRSVWRYLSDSTLPYRRLQALYVNPAEPLASTWAQQFGGEIVNASDLAERLRRGERLRFADNRLDLVFLDEALGDDRGSILEEAVRVLAPHGTFLLRQSFGPEQGNHFSRLDELRATLRSAGLHVENELRFSSRAVRFDWLPLLVCRKRG